MIEVLKPGLATSVQDIGRKTFATFGVPQSGIMDQYAAKIANLLVGNSQKAALLEITQIGPKLRFHHGVLVAVAGLEAEIMVNDEKIPINERFFVEKNTVLEIKRISAGSRVYLAVFGGLRTKLLLGSRSMYDGITPQSQIKRGDFLPTEVFVGRKKDQLSSVRFANEMYASEQIDVYPGPEFNHLSQTAKQHLLENKFSIANDSNRMAYLLKENLKNELEPILTGPVLPGTVQLTPGGNLIILMRDCQVTGGYPRVLQVSEKSLNVLAQKRTKDSIRFSIEKYDF